MKNVLQTNGKVKLKINKIMNNIMNGSKENVKNTLEFINAGLISGDGNASGYINEDQMKQAMESAHIDKMNDLIDSKIEKFEEHSKELLKAAEAFADANEFQVKPVVNNVIIKPFDFNPFQKIKKKGNLIIDMGGAAPTYRNNDTGEWEEEESVVKVGVVMELGPECKWLQIGDCVFYPRNSVMPVPFYKQNLELVNENRIIAIVNDNLKERFK